MINQCHQILKSLHFHTECSHSHRKYIATSLFWSRTCRSPMLSFLQSERKYKNEKRCYRHLNLRWCSAFVHEKRSVKLTWLVVVINGDHCIVNTSHFKVQCSWDHNTGFSFGYLRRKTEEEVFFYWNCCGVTACLLQHYLGFFKMYF